MTTNKSTSPPPNVASSPPQLRPRPSPVVICVTPTPARPHALRPASLSRRAASAPRASERESAGTQPRVARGSRLSGHVRHRQRPPAPARHRTRIQPASGASTVHIGHFGEERVVKVAVIRRSYHTIPLDTHRAVAINTSTSIYASPHPAAPAMLLYYSFLFCLFGLGIAGGESSLRRTHIRPSAPY